MSNQNNTANVIGAGFTTIDQSNENIAVNFASHW